MYVPPAHRAFDLTVHVLWFSSFVQHFLVRHDFTRSLSFYTPFALVGVTRRCWDSSPSARTANYYFHSAVPTQPVLVVDA